MLTRLVDATRVTLSILAIVLGMGSASVAADLAQPTGEIILTVSGDLSMTNAEGAAVFDLAMLQGLPAHSFRTKTIWTEGADEYTGVLLKDILDLLGISEGTITAQAINDYSVEIPVSDAKTDGPIIAYAVDGKEMSIRDKGPLWIVYPYDSNSDYQSEVIFSRSIWQLDRIAIKR